jgi:hypothetical protein
VDPRVRKEDWKGWRWEHQRKKEKGAGGNDRKIRLEALGTEERENKGVKESDEF